MSNDFCEMTIEDIKVRLQEMLSPKRYNHSIGVMEASRRLSEMYGGQTEKAVLAGLLHDCARDLSAAETFSICDKYGIAVNDLMRKQPQLLHGIIGSYIARDIFLVTSSDVLSAVENHTMGNEGMDKLSSIVFVSDYIEDGRSFSGVEELRRIAKESLEKAVVACLDNTIAHLLNRGLAIHPQTIITRNWAITLL